MIGNVAYCDFSRLGELDILWWLTLSPMACHCTPLATHLPFDRPSVYLRIPATTLFIVNFALIAMSPTCGDTRFTICCCCCLNQNFTFIIDVVMLVVDVIFTVFSFHLSSRFINFLLYCCVVCWEYLCHLIMYVLCNCYRWISVLYVCLYLLLIITWWCSVFTVIKRFCLTVWSCSLVWFHRLCPCCYHLCLEILYDKLFQLS